MNTQYRKNLKDVAIACKNYTDKRFDDFKWELGANDFSVYNDTTSAYQKTAPSNTLAGKIKKINGNCVKYAPSTASDDTTALLKSIPTNTYTMNVHSVGGMSYKSENLIVLSDVAETTTNGITYKVENGVITLNGTATTGVYPNIPLETSLTLNGTYSFKPFSDGTISEARGLFLMENTETGDYLTATRSVATGISLNKTYAYFRINISSGTSFTNFTVKPMLVNGSTVPPTFEVGFSGIRNSAVTSVVAEGENLLNVPNVSQTTTNGITYKIQNGVITLSGTANASINIPFNVTENSLDTSFVLSLFNAVPNNDIVFILNFIDENGFSLRTSNANAYRTFNRANSTLKSFNISIANGASISGTLQIKPMITNGSTIPTTFVNYIAPITKTIPASIQALAGYGWGINDTCYNYIDFERKVFVQKVARVDLGSLDDWIIRSGETNVFQNGTLKNVVKKSSSSSEVANALCDIYLNATTDNVLGHTPKTIAVFPSGYFGIYDTSYSTVEAFITAMSGVYLYYELATPVETDISSYLTDFNPITLNNNYASVSFTNTYDYDVPSKLSFYGTIYEVLCTSVVANGTTINLANNDAKYGWSAGTVRNVRDYDTNKGIKKVSVINSSNLSWDISARGFLYSTRIEDAKYGEDAQLTNVSCANYETLPYNYMKNNHVKGICMGDDKRIYIYDPDVSTNNVPVFNIYYELATLVEENITPISSQLLDVTSGDTITFTNTNNEAVSSEIVFLIEEEKSNE